MHFLVLIFILLAGCSSQQSPQNTLIGSAEPKVEKHSGLLWYLFDFDQKLTVKTRLFSPPEHTKFYLPGKWAGRDDWASRISIVGANGPEGPRFITIDRDQGVVEIDARDQPWVELEYTVDLSASDPMFPQFENKNVFAFVPTFIVLPAAQILNRLKDIPVEVHAPNDWLVASTWPIQNAGESESHENRTVWGFVAADTGELNDAFIAAGPDLNSSGDDVLRVVVEKEHTKTFQELTSVARTILKRYRSEFGAVGPASMFIRTKTATGPFEYVGMGRRGGFVVQLDPKQPTNDELKLLVAHEALHLWNGHWLLPNPEREPETRWFKEGLTHYFALKSSVRAGAVSKKFALDELARLGENYARNPIVMGGETRPLDRIRLPYDHGALVALVIDSLLYRQSGGEISIEDWIRAVAADAHSLSPGYDLGSLHAALEAVSGGDPAVHNFWKKQVRDRAPLDLRAVFEVADLHWLPPRGKQPAKLVALDRKKPVYVQLFE